MRLKSARFVFPFAFFLAGFSGTATLSSRAAAATTSLAVTPLAEPFPFPAALLRDHDGSAFRTDSMRGSVYVVDLIFTSCRSICPALTQTMARIDRATPGIDVRFASISVDPGRDTPGRLRLFAKRYGASFARWKFLTGEPSVVRALIRDGLFTSVERSGKDPAEIIHSERFFLVDAAGNVRAIAPVHTESEIQNLIQSVRVLAAVPRAQVR